MYLLVYKTDNLLNEDDQRTGPYCNHNQQIVHQIITYPLNTSIINIYTSIRYQNTYGSW